MPRYPFIAAAVVVLTTTGSVPPSLAADDSDITLLPEFRRIGGAGNNLSNPGLDVIPGRPELTLAPLNFEPGTTNGLVKGPNPRTISNVIAGGTGANGQNASTNDSVASAWLYVFGQFVDHDLDLESTPTSGPAIDIIVPNGDPTFTPGTHIHMKRDTRNQETNTIVNTTTGYLDLSQLYGSTIGVANSLRNRDGTLKTSNNGQSLQVVDHMFVAGDPRVMENPELAATTTLFMREHNFWVGRLKEQHRNWTGDQLYNMAKAITTAEYQNIVYTEYLPLLIGPLEEYEGYQPQTNAQVTQEFSTAAFRAGHSQVSDTQTGRDNNGNVVFSESLAKAFFNTAEDDEKNGINALLRNLAVEYSQATDAYTVDVLRNLLFAPLPGGEIDQVDLIAIDIQRERDAGLGTLNQTRKALDLRPYRSFSQLTSDTILQKDLKKVYGNIDNVDLFMGGLVESHAPNATVGLTFQAIIGRQFHALRSGDRFFWRNQRFDQHTAEMISATTLATLLRRDTDSSSVQDHVFVVAAPATQPAAPAPAMPVDNHGRQGTPVAIR